MRVNDAISGLILLLFAAAVIGYSTTFPAMPGQRFGPALFPQVIGTGLGFAGLVLIVSGLRRLRVEGWAQPDEWVTSGRQVSNALAILMALAVYIVAAGPVGFIPTAFVVTAALMIKLRQGHVLSSLLISAAATFVIYYAFARLLLVPLPGGLLRAYGW